MTRKELTKLWSKSCRRYCRLLGIKWKVVTHVLDDMDNEVLACVSKDGYNHIATFMIHERSRRLAPSTIIKWARHEAAHVLWHSLTADADEAFAVRMERALRE